MVNDPEPHGPLDEAAIGFHELYSAFRRAGFTRSEALTIIAKASAELISAAPEQDEDDAGNG